jgi:hypothetical protein
MALATAVKISPLFYAVNLLRMRRSSAAAFLAVLLVALVVPYFVLENYLYIFTFQSENKGGVWQTSGGVAISVPFSVLLTYVSARRNFDWEERIGWGLLPVAMLLAFQLNVARHLLVVLLVPDKRALRSAAAAVSVAVYYLSFGSMAFNSTLPICSALLYAILLWELRQVDPAVVRDDWRHPWRTARMIFGEGAGRALSGSPATTNCLGRYLDRGRDRHLPAPHPPVAGWRARSATSSHSSG